MTRRVFSLNDIALPVMAGMGLRVPHINEVCTTWPSLGWVEVHSENYFMDGGSALAALTAVRAHYPVSLHGVGLSMGSAQPLDPHHLRQLKVLVTRIEPAAVSEHLCWSTAGPRCLNDLLPLPYTHEALAYVCDHIDCVQQVLGRRILLENIASYLRFVPEAWPEWEFIAEVVRRTGCLLLLDINNLYVSAMNHGFSANVYLESMPAAAVAEIHLAGYEAVDGLFIDTHARRVHEPVWRLYREALRRFGPIPTLIEWDQDLPPLSVLREEAAQAQGYLDSCKVVGHAVSA